MMPVFTIIGYYEDNGQRFGGVIEANNAEDAEDVFIVSAQREDGPTRGAGDCMVVAVLEGEHRCVDAHESARGIGDVETLTCMFCGEACVKRFAHAHGDGHIGDECWG